MIKSNYEKYFSYLYGRLNTTSNPHPWNPKIIFSHRPRTSYNENTHYTDDIVFVFLSVRHSFSSIFLSSKKVYFLIISFHRFWFGIFGMSNQKKSELFRSLSSHHYRWTMYCIQLWETLWNVKYINWMYTMLVLMLGLSVKSRNINMR